MATRMPSRGDIIPTGLESNTICAIDCTILAPNEGDVLYTLIVIHLQKMLD